MSFFKSKIQKVKEILNKDLPTIKYKVNIAVNKIFACLDKLKDAEGKKLMDDSKNEVSKEAKTLLVETALATFASEIATSATGKTMSVTTAQTKPVANLIVKIMNITEYKVGDYLDDEN